MDNSEKKKNRTKWERIFRFAITLLIIGIVLFAWLKWFSIWQQQNIKHQRQQVQEREDKLKSYESATEYDKLLAIKDLESKDLDMPWSDHIQRILDMFKDLQDLDSDSSAITLSDFNISLDEISLKWNISALKALYYNSESWTFKALLDRFESLGFIQNMRIKTYEKVDSRNFEFILNANVVSNE